MEMASAASVAGLLDAGLERGPGRLHRHRQAASRTPTGPSPAPPNPTRIPPDPEAAAAAPDLA